MRVLLHTCCAPCLIYPFRQLKDKGFDVRSLFYNPNIHPLIEYKNRKQAVEVYAQKEGITVSFPEYSPAEFFHAVNLKEQNGRCLICWELRLRKTAELAKKDGFDYFSTTLLVSPYQDQQVLKSIGEKVFQESGVKFFYEDFRPGFRLAHDEARAQGIYCQKYCGCIYSEIERDTNKSQVTSRKS